MKPDEDDMDRLASAITGETPRENVMALAKEYVLQGLPWDQAIRKAREDLTSLGARLAESLQREG